MTHAREMLQPRCPNCKKTGPLTLVVSTVVIWRESGSAVIECTGCHSLWGLMYWTQNAMDFFVKIPIVENQS
jgi:hypothetical protein